MDRARVFAHANDVLRRPLGRWKMEMREFGDRVAYAFVNRPGDFASLRMGDRNVHITRRDRRGDSLKSIGHGQDDIGPEILE